jgi:ADP-heptose:LPS heptosyltransferase
MKPKTMRAIDWYAGIPLCYVLAGLKLLTGLFSSASKNNREVRIILVMKFFGMGSIILTAPAIAALREKFPGATIHYLTFAQNRGIVEMLSLGDKYHFIETSGVLPFARSTIKSIWLLRRARVDLGFDFEFFAKFPLIVACFAGVRKNAGFSLTSEPWRNILLDYSGYYNHYWHVKDIFLSLVYLAATGDNYYLDFGMYATRFGGPRKAVPQASRERVTARLAKAGLSGKALALINPHASKELTQELRRWPEVRYAQLCERMLKAYPGRFIVFTGTKDQVPQVEHIRALIAQKLRERTINFAGQTSIEELAALCEDADVFVTTDSGPMHVGALVDAHTVALFSADTPVLYAPLASRVRIICPHLYCIPSYTVYTGKEPIVQENRAAQLISVDEVYAAFASLFHEGLSSVGT